MSAHPQPAVEPTQRQRRPARTARAALPESGPVQPLMRDPKAFEAAFLANQLAEKTELARHACIMALALTTLFAVLDVWAIPSSLAQVWAIRALMVIAILTVFASTGSAEFVSRYEPSMMGMFFMLGSGVEVMVLISSPDEAARSVYFSGVLLVLMGILAFTYLGRTATLLCSAALLSGYVGISLGPHQAGESGELPIVLANSAFFVAVYAVGWISRSLRDKHARESFRRKCELEQAVESKERARQVSEYLAHHDPLTGLPNRKSLQRRLDAKLAKARGDGGQLALLFIDLDGFKSINDRFGHQAGDHVLRSAAARMRRCIKQHDLLARLAGDEFVVVAPVPADAPVLAQVLARRIAEQLTKPIDIAHEKVVLGASIGTATFPADGESGTALLGAADGDMYRVKRASKERALAEFGTATV